MRIIGHGIDLIAVERIARMVHRHSDRFLERCYTPSERGYASSSPRRQIERLAVRFAAKEAVLKALGTGWRSGIAWTDIEIVKLPSGQPTVTLGGEAGAIATAQGIDSWMISLSHTDSHAMASAIALAWA